MIDLFLKIFLTLIRSILVGAFFGMSIGYPIIGTIGAPIGMIFVLIIVVPLLPFIFGLCVYLDKKDKKNKKIFLISGFGLGLLYGWFLDFLSKQTVNDLKTASDGHTVNILEFASLLSMINWFPYHFIVVTALTGFFVSWFYWRRMYSKAKSSKFF